MGIDRFCRWGLPQGGGTKTVRMGELFHGARCPRQAWWGAPGAGRFPDYPNPPHTVCPHAFVPGPSSWAAAATGTSLNHLSCLEFDQWLFPPPPPFMGSWPLEAPSIVPLDTMPACLSVGLRSHSHSLSRFPTRQMLKRRLSEHTRLPFRPSVEKHLLSPES